MDVTGVILAGGKSRRMGEDKRFLKLGETTLLDRAQQAMREVFQEVLVIIAQDSDPLVLSGATVYRDLYPHCGSLGGLYTGITYASHQRIFAVACDMPFLDPALIQWFVNRAPDADVVVARLDQGLQPLHAVYRKSVLPHMKQLIDLRELRIHALVSNPRLAVTTVSPEEWTDSGAALRSFHNLNAPEDVQVARDELLRHSLRSDE
mgnify:CR=1 FL=1